MTGYSKAHRGQLMARGSLFLLAIFLLGMSFGVSFASDTRDYVLGPGDKIQIQVYGEDDMAVQSLVGDSGNVSYPFLGDIRVRGRSVTELEKIVTDALTGPYFVAPDVTVSILEYRQFYINGRVEQPGGFAFQPGMTVRKAISLAGGFDERADRDKIFIVRGDNVNAKPIRVKLDTKVKPGDIITVERSFF